MAETCRRVLEIEIPPDVVKKRAEQIAAQFQRRVRLPGFRPGKAPLSLIQQRYRDDIRGEVLRDLVPEYLGTHTKEKNWEPVGNPTVTDIEYSEDRPLKFKATMEIFPEFELQDYADLHVDVPELEVSEEEVQKTLEHLREEQATYVNLDPRPLEDGDHASIAVKEIAGGPEAASGKTHDVLYPIGGENALPEFTENLRGAQVGEERTFSVTYPAEFEDAAQAGKTITYQVKVLGLKKKQVPELDDEFAKQLGDFDTLEIVRDRIREDILKSKQREAEQNARDEVRKKLVDLHEFPVPEILVERQIEKRLDAVRRQIESRGMNRQSLQLDWGKIRASQRDAAVDDVKASFILEKVAERGNVEVAPADLEEEIQKIAAVTRQSPEVVHAHLTKQDGLDRMKSRLRTEKALDLVFLNARKTALHTDQ